MFPLDPTFSEAPKDEGIGCVSKLSVKNCTYTWIIDNYSVLCATREKFRSPSFTALDDDFKWCLEHKISWRQFENEDYVSFILLPADDNDFKKYSPVSGNLKASVRNMKGACCYTTEKGGSFKIIFNGSPRYFELVLYSAYKCQKELVNNDKFHVVCNLKYLKTNNNSSRNYTVSGPNPFKTIQCSLSRDFERIRINGEFSDMTISVKDKNYPVHKTVLAARSSVFSAMFKSSMQESQKNHITITDIDQDVFEEMLHYIYTGKTKNLAVLAFELLPVADKYDLKDLRTMCEEVLYKKLAPDNALKILILADMHHAKELKILAIRYIKGNSANCKNFKNSEIYKVLTTSRPELMADMLAEFLNTE
ncbi:speckle-type POZ protein B-like [Planococcus citri]|uniref:speckle-type POZ protein B-like n=1 Tax=Planococcus citri TaxID=170843 RepID=UPI0031F74019